MTAAEVQHALHLLELGRPADAQPLITAALVDRPDSAQLHGLLARSLLALGELQEALVSADRTVALSPEDEYGHRIRSIVLNRLGNHEAAVDAAVEAVRRDPESWLTHLQVATASVSARGRLVDARAASRRAVALAPHEPDAHATVGLVEQHYGNDDVARAAYEHALRLDPHHAQSRNNLTVLQRPRSVVRAIEGYAAVLRMNPSDSIARANLDAQVRRFGQRVYVAALVGYLGTLSIAVDQRTSRHGTPLSWGVAALTVGAVVLSTALLASRLRGGIRDYALRRVGRDLELTARLVLATIMLVLGVLVAVDGSATELGIAMLRPIGFANVALIVVWAARRA